MSMTAYCFGAYKDVRGARAPRGFSLGGGRSLPPVELWDSLGEKHACPRQARRKIKWHTPVGRKGIRFLFRNPAAEPHTIRALERVFVGVTQNDLETPSGDPGRVFFSV